jgi:MFS family permease
MLGYVYGKGLLFQIFISQATIPKCLSGQKLNSQQDLGVKVAAPVGTLVGQLLFGWLADVLGRKRMCE